MVEVRTPLANSEREMQFMMKQMMSVLVKRAGGSVTFDMKKDLMLPYPDLVIKTEGEKLVLSLKEGPK